MNSAFLKDFIRYKKYQYLVSRDKDNEKIFTNDPSTKDQNLLYSLRKDGYAKIPNFFSKIECSKLIEAIDKFIKDNPNYIWKDDINSDNRIFGAENISIDIKKTLKNFISYSQEIGEHYLKQKIGLFMVMANRTVFRNKNIGSGAGWHKDSYSKQFKSILYLNDVNSSNGPFQIIKNSNKNFFMFKLFLKLKNKFPNTRFSQQDISAILKNEKNTIIELTAKAGTLLLVDTSFLHRGKPIENNSRYALTNYFFPPKQFEDHKNHFQPKIENLME
ncbi:MAG: phytanoyl-CoA dioxygenase family protein [Pelagibacterales bacterium]|nr:phytanoyl-CoA dioxygenase family protein [Pelagibacterales bacterium]